MNVSVGKVVMIVDVVWLVGVFLMIVLCVVNGELNVRLVMQECVCLVLFILCYVFNQVVWFLVVGWLICIGVLYGNLLVSYLGEFFVGLLSQVMDGCVQLMVQKCEVGVDEDVVVW